MKWEWTEEKITPWKRSRRNEPLIKNIAGWLLGAWKNGERAKKIKIWADMANTAGRIDTAMNEQGYSMGRHNNLDGSFFVWCKGEASHQCNKCYNVFFNLDILAEGGTRLSKRDLCPLRCGGQVGVRAKTEKERRRAEIVAMKALARREKLKRARVA